MSPNAAHTTTQLTLHYEKKGKQHRSEERAVQPFKHLFTQVVLIAYTVFCHTTQVLIDRNTTKQMKETKDM